MASPWVVGLGVEVEVGVVEEVGVIVGTTAEDAMVVPTAVAMIAVLRETRDPKVVPALRRRPLLLPTTSVTSVTSVTAVVGTHSALIRLPTIHLHRLQHLLQRRRSQHPLQQRTTSSAAIRLGRQHLHRLWEHQQWRRQLLLLLLLLLRLEAWTTFSGRQHRLQSQPLPRLPPLQ